ncbi:TetR/AcrR family transcriptional regulator [Saccharomonospora sp. NPDC006951]
MARRNGTAARPTDDVDWRCFTPLDLTPILAAALDAFYEQGFHGTTVRDIARRVGQTVPSLYYHHDSKEGVFAALLDLAASDVGWRTKAAAVEGGDRADVRFALVVEAIVLHMTHRVRLASLDQEMRHLSPANRRKYGARRREVETLLAGIVETGAEEGLFGASRPAESARAVLGMCQSIAKWYQPGDALSPEELADRYVDIALSAVGGTKRAKLRARRERQRTAARS